MDQAFKEYLDIIKFSALNHNIVERIIKEYNDLIGEEPKDIFISTLSDKGKIKYNSLLLKYEDFICEAKGFMTKFDYDFAPINKELIDYWNIECKDDKPLDESIDIHITIQLKSKVQIVLHAVGNNCSRLIEFFKKIVT